MREFSEGDEIWVEHLVSHGRIVSIGENPPGVKVAPYALVELWDGWREEWITTHVLLHHVKRGNIPFSLPKYTNKTIKATCTKCGETTFIVNA
jgi:hypothetical protein